MLLRAPPTTCRLGPAAARTQQHHAAAWAWRGSQQLAGWAAPLAPQQAGSAGAAAARARPLATVARSFAADAVAAADPAQAAADSPIYPADYDADYHNFVALTGNIASPSRSGTPGAEDECFSFVLRVVQRNDAQTVESFVVQCFGELAQQAAGKLQDETYVQVQGALFRDSTADGGVKVLARDIGLIATPAPEALVAAAGGEGEASRPPAANPQQHVQQAQRAAERPRGQPIRPPGMPETPGSPQEAQWMSLFTEPSTWWDNREDKRNPKAPDFKHKTSGDALWCNSYSPQWVRDSLQLLPGGKPYVPPTYSSGSGGAAVAPITGDWMPQQPGSEREEQWMRVFTNYRDWWDNRANKRNPRAPDFKEKNGTIALWLTDKLTPPWVHDNLHRLPTPPPPR